LKRLLIKNASHIATFDDNNTVKTGEDILIEEGKIARIGASLDMPGAEVIDGRDKLVMPGMVNTHHHLYQTLTRNIPRVLNSELFDWLINLYEIWRELDERAVYVSTLVGLGELLLTGCTTSTDMFYVFPENKSGELIDEQVKAAREIGMRFHPCRGSMSCGRSKGGLPPDDVVQQEATILADCERLIKKYHDAGPFSMCRIALGPCSPFSVTRKLLEETRDMAKRYKVRCHTHLAETRDEEKYCLEKFGLRPFGYMRDVGWLGDDVWFAHCVYLSQEEIDEMGRTSTGVAHCPVSNLRLGSGIAPIPEMLKAGVPVGMAVDGSASNDSSDMLGEVRTGLLAHRYRSGAGGVTPLEMLTMATRGGAKVLGHEMVGSLEPGKAADVIMWNLKELGFTGALHEPLSAIVMAGYSHVVHTSVVNGEVVVKEGKLVKVKEEDLIKEGNEISEKLVRNASKRTGIDFLKNG
jgi:8-oxoguanine deaminase